MHIYDTFIKGSGYSAFGYALERKNSLICEASQLCDPHFFGALKGFHIEGKMPENPFAKEFYLLCKEKEILKDGRLNISALESAFCTFLKDKEYNLLLNTECVEIKPDNGMFKILISSNSGLETVYAERIFDTTPSQTDRKYLSVLCTDVEESLLCSVFEGAFYDNAFYENRMVAYIPVETDDITDAKIHVYDKWRENIKNSQIISFAPNFAQLYCNRFIFEKDNYMKVSEGIFQSPFDAFEFGAQCGGEEE